MRVRIDPGEPSARQPRRARRQVDRPSVADPRHHGPGLQPSTRGSGFPRRAVDRFVPGPPHPQGSTCTRGVVRERCRHPSRVTVPRGTPGPAEAPDAPLEVEGEGWPGSSNRPSDLDCGNSGTSMRLLAGVVAAAPFRSVLTRRREPRRRARWSASPSRSERWGPTVATTDGHAPIAVARRERCAGSTYATPVPTAQVKSAVLLAGARGRGRDDGPRAGAHARSHRAGARRARRPDRARRHVRHDRAVPAPRLRGPRTGRSVVGRLPRGGGRPDGLGADDHGRRVEPHPHPLPGRDGADGRAHRGARRRATELGEPVGDLWVAPCDGVRATRVERGRAAPGDRRGPDPRDDGRARGGRHVVPRRAASSA